jgi:hypothetical protein
MKADPILAELWAVRDRLAAQCDYDLDAIFRQVKTEEAKSGLPYVECPARRLAAAQDDAVEPDAHEGASAAK